MVQKLQESGPVLFNRQIAEGIYHLSVLAPRIVAAACPGQFVQVKVASEPSVQFLRMPFAVFDADVDAGSVDICYQVVGDGTEQLTHVGIGDEVDLVGPIGNGWHVPAGVTHALLACGGVGTPALKLLADELAAQGARVDVVIGATTADRVACTEQFEDSVRRSQGALYIATDDGSMGVKGFVNAVTDELLATNDYDYVAVCGPPLMERSVALPAIEHGVTCEVSMERLMACGVGACLGCVVETTGGLKRCCVDGPVFDASEVVW